MFQIVKNAQNSNPAVSSVAVLARFEIFATGFGLVASKNWKKNQTGLDFKTLLEGTYF